MLPITLRLRRFASRSKHQHRHQEPGDVRRHPGFGFLHHKDCVFLRLGGCKSTVSLRRCPHLTQIVARRSPIVEFGGCRGTHPNCGKDVAEPRHAAIFVHLLSQ
ncbi:MAG TPA: hypothetical protein VJL61_09935 [Rhodanobacteraceae bacterium]|nr:hypothetical protein [Rhodanobacteraceae bacterium]